MCVVVRKNPAQDRKPKDIATQYKEAPHHVA